MAIVLQWYVDGVWYLPGNTNRNWSRLQKARKNSAELSETWSANSVLDSTGFSCLGIGCKENVDFRKKLRWTTGACKTSLVDDVKKRKPFRLLFVFSWESGALKRWFVLENFAGGEVCEQ